MKSLREMLHAHKLDRVADRIEALARRSIRLAADKESEAAVTRLGGRPNLPKKLDWPTWREEPLAFVAQLDLTTLPRLDDVPLPATGSLYFFYEGGENAWGFSPEDKGSCCVLHSPTPLTDSPLRNLPEELEGHLRFKGVRLSPEPVELTAPGLEDKILADLGMTMDEREAYFAFQQEWTETHAGCIHRIGGYPECIQGDPKLEAHLVSHGLYCGDSSGYKTGKEKGLWPGSVDWKLLLQVDSEDRADMMWGDVGRLYFLIHKTALEKRQFDKTWLVFQCS